MQAFEVHWYQWMWVMVLTGVSIFLFLYLGFYLPSRPGRPPGKEAPREPFPAGIEAASRGIPPVLWLLFVGFGVYLVAYTLYMWLWPVTY